MWSRDGWRCRRNSSVRASNDLELHFVVYDAGGSDSHLLSEFTIVRWAGCSKPPPIVRWAGCPKPCPCSCSHLLLPGSSVYGGGRPLNSMTNSPVNHVRRYNKVQSDVRTLLIGLIWAESHLALTARWLSLHAR